VKVYGAGGSKTLFCRLYLEVSGKPHADTSWCPLDMRLDEPWWCSGCGSEHTAPTGN